MMMFKKPPLLTPRGGFLLSIYFYYFFFFPKSETAIELNTSPIKDNIIATYYLTPFTRSSYTHYICFIMD